MSRSVRIVRFACVLALVALALMIWSLVDPRPIPVVLAMSVAQGLGTLSLAMFLVVVVADLRRADRAPPRAGSNAGAQDLRLRADVAHPAARRSVKRG